MGQILDQGGFYTLFGICYILLNKHVDRVYELYFMPATKVDRLAHFESVFMNIKNGSPSKHSNTPKQHLIVNMR